MIPILSLAAALQLATAFESRPAPNIHVPPTCSPERRIRELPKGSGTIVNILYTDPRLTPLLDSLVQLWTPEYFVIDAPVSPRLDSLFRHRNQVVDALWARDSVRLLEALTTIIVDHTHYALYFGREAASDYQRLWGKERPLLANTVNDWDYSRILVYLNALRPPLSAAGQDVVLGLACDAAWQLQAVRRDSKYLRAFVYGSAIYWPAGALMVVDNARDLLTGPHLTVLEKAMRGTEGVF